MYSQDLEAIFLHTKQTRSLLAQCVRGNRFEGPDKFREWMLGEVDSSEHSTESLMAPIQPSITINDIHIKLDFNDATAIGKGLPPMYRSVLLTLNDFVFQAWTNQGQVPCLNLFPGERAIGMVVLFKDAEDSVVGSSFEFVDLAISVIIPGNYAVGFGLLMDSKEWQRLLSVPPN